MPVLGSGHPQADVMLLKHAPTTSEVEEGVAFYGRAGTALMKSLTPPPDRPARRVRHALREVPGQRPVARRPRLHRARGRGDRDRPAQDDRGHGRSTRSTRSTTSTCRSRGRSSRSPAASSSSRRRSRRSSCRTSTARSTRSRPSGSSGPRSACWASGTRSCRPTSVRSPGSSLVGELRLGLRRRRALPRGLRWARLSARSRRCRSLPGPRRAAGRRGVRGGRGVPRGGPAAQDVGAAANPVEALAGAAAGLLFAWAFATPGAVVALPLVVAGVDLASVLTGPRRAAARRRAGRHPDPRPPGARRRRVGRAARRPRRDVPRAVRGVVAAVRAAPADRDPADGRRPVRVGRARRRRRPRRSPRCRSSRRRSCCPALDRLPAAAEAVRRAVGCARWTSKRRLSSPPSPTAARSAAPSSSRASRRPILESGSAPLCSIHAAEVLPLEEEGVVDEAP